MQRVRRAVPGARRILHLLAGSTGAPGYDPHFFETLEKVEDRHFWFLGRRAVILAALRRAVPDLSRRRLFDVGCGTGGLLIHFLRSGLALAGACDVYPESLCVVRRRLQLPLVLVDLGREPPLGPGHDLLGLFDVLEHVDDDVAMLRSLLAGLLPGGVLVLTVPAHPSLFDEMDELAFHRRRYTRRSLRSALEQAGFEVRLLSHFMAPLVRPASPCARWPALRGAQGAGGAATARGVWRRAGAERRPAGPAGRGAAGSREAAGAFGFLDRRGREPAVVRLPLGRFAGCLAAVASCVVAAQQAWVSAANFQGHDEWLGIELASRGVVGVPYANRPLVFLWQALAQRAWPDDLRAYWAFTSLAFLATGLLTGWLAHRLLPRAPLLALLAGVFAASWAPLDWLRLDTTLIAGYAGSPPRRCSPSCCSWSRRHAPAGRCCWSLAPSRRAALGVEGCCRCSRSRRCCSRERLEDAPPGAGDYGCWRGPPSSSPAGCSRPHRRCWASTRTGRTRCGSTRRRSAWPRGSFSSWACSSRRSSRATCASSRTRPCRSRSSACPSGGPRLALRAARDRRHPGSGRGRGRRRRAGARLRRALRPGARGGSPRPEPQPAALGPRLRPGARRRRGVERLSLRPGRRADEPFAANPARPRLDAALALSIVAVGTGRVVAMQAEWDRARNAFPLQGRALADLVRLAPELRPNTLVVLADGSRAGYWLTFTFRHAVSLMYSGKVIALLADGEPFAYRGSGPPRASPSCPG